MIRRIWPCALLLLAVSPLTAQEEPPAAEEAEEQEESPFADFEKLVADAEHVEGFLDLYLEDGKLHMAVPRDMIGEGFLLDTRVAQGIGASGLYGGTTPSFFEMDLMAIEEHGGTLYLVKRPHRFGAEHDARARAAVDLTIGPSVVHSAEVAAMRPDSARVIDVTDWLVSDLSGISRTVRFAAATRPGQPGSASFDRSRSYLER